MKCWEHRQKDCLDFGGDLDPYPGVFVVSQTEVSSWYL